MSKDRIAAFWRTIITDSESETGFAPRCSDLEHGPFVLDCCPEPHVEVFDAELAARITTATNALSAERLSQLADCSSSRYDGLHCLHYQEGDGACCDCGRPNWCPEEGL
jgi:hypothetical protein